EDRQVEGAADLAVGRHREAARKGAGRLQRLRAEAARLADDAVLAELDEAIEIELRGRMADPEAAQVPRLAGRFRRGRAGGDQGCEHDARGQGLHGSFLPRGYRTDIAVADSGKGRIA